MIGFVERDLTKDELEIVHAGFDKHQLQHGNVSSPRTRLGFVLMDNNKLVGCASGLRDNKWYYLSDLWLEEGYRSRGYGAILLELWEKRVEAEGVKNIFTWTAGFQAPRFYEKQGYNIFVEFNDYYQNGHSRIGLRKTLT